MADETGSRKRKGSIPKKFSDSNSTIMPVKVKTEPEDSTLAESVVKPLGISVTESSFVKSEPAVSAKNPTDYLKDERTIKPAIETPPHDVTSSSMPSTERNDVIIRSLLLAEAESLNREQQRGQRRLFSPQQLVSLRRAFTENPYPGPRQYADIATNVGMSERSVRLWFQNVRAKIRKRGPETIHKPTRLERHHIRVAAAVENLKQNHCLPQNVSLPPELTSALKYAKENSMRGFETDVSMQQERKKDRSLDYQAYSQNVSERFSEEATTDSDASSVSSDSKTSPHPLSPDSSSGDSGKKVVIGTPQETYTRDVKPAAEKAVGTYQFETMTASVVTPDHPFCNLMRAASRRKRKARSSDKNEESSDPRPEPTQTSDKKPRASPLSSDSDDDKVHPSVQRRRRRRNAPVAQHSPKLQQGTTHQAYTGALIPPQAYPGAAATRTLSFRDSPFTTLPNSEEQPLDLSMKKTYQPLPEKSVPMVSPTQHAQWLEMMKSYRQMPFVTSYMPVMTMPNALYPGLTQNAWPAIHVAPY